LYVILLNRLNSFCMSDNGLILTGSELMNLPQESNNYLIESILWENDNIMLLAREKVGKSILALQMACALSCGESFLGEYEIPSPMPILYIQTESTRHETIERLRSMTHQDGVNWEPKNFHLMCTHSLELDTNHCFNWLIREIEVKKLNPKVIFLDPLYMCMKGGLTDDTTSRDLSRNIRKLGEGYGCGVVVVHHEHRMRRNKDGDVLNEGDEAIMGSFVWKAFPNHIIHLRLRPDKIRVLSCDTQRSNRVIENMKLELVQPLPLRYKILGTPDHPSYVNTVFSWLDHHGQLCAKDIHTATGLSLSAVKKSLSYLTKPSVNKLNKINPGQRPTYYETRK